MTEEKESFFSSIGLFFKFNPLVLFVAFVLMNVMISVFISQMELGQKMLALVSSMLLLCSMKCIDYKKNRS